MSKHVIITGASDGIGLAVANSLVKKHGEALQLHVLARRAPPQSFLDLAKEKKTAVHIHQFDLSNSAEADTFFTEKVFKPIKSDTATQSVHFFQNAGLLGDIKPSGQFSASTATTVMTVNATTPMLLMNAFVREFSDFDGEKRLSLTTSGAATRPFPWWSAYCASKAAAEMALHIVRVEQASASKPIHCLAISPGIVWSSMQDTIAKAGDNWPLKDFFVNFRKEGKGRTNEQSGEEIAELLMGDKFVELATGETGRIDMI